MFKRETKTYADGLLDGADRESARFERVLAVLREELADARADRDKQLVRGDAACDLLLQHLGARAISLVGQAQEERRAERNARAVRTFSALPDPTDELPYGHPDGLYASERDANRFATGEDITQ